MGRRKAEPEKAASHERWLITYADLITLLMIFFVLMYTISNVNAKKFSQLSASMSVALGGAPKIIGESQGESFIDNMTKAGAQTAAEVEAEALDKATKSLEEYINLQGLSGKVEITREERGLVISLKESLLFKIGSADINKDAKGTILSVGQVLAVLRNNIKIEGHTCNLPIKTAQFPSNWELSTTRATNVVKFLINEGNFNPERLSATGYGEFRPIVPNTTEKNRARNRRVDIVVLKQKYDSAEPGFTGTVTLENLKNQAAQ